MKVVYTKELDFFYSNLPKLTKAMAKETIWGRRNCTVLEKFLRFKENIAVNWEVRTKEVEKYGTPLYGTNVLLPLLACVLLCFFVKYVNESSHIVHMHFI